jgi:hypothetical protein
VVHKSLRDEIFANVDKSSFHSNGHLVARERVSERVREKAKSR